MDAAMAVAHKAASNGVVQDNSHNVIQTVTNLDNLGSNAAIGTNLSAVTSSPRPNSAPTISTDSTQQQDPAALPWNQLDANPPQTETNPVATHHSSMLCVVGKKRPCDPMSDVINSPQGVLPANTAGTYLNNTMSTSVTFTPSGLPHYMSPGNYSQHPHAKNAAILQATLLSSQQPIMVY
ncbi:MAG: hypothetical protein VX313_05560 [Bacteroidota bacterium]|nr:hypothetical protein [Bacteroidota bacterium]